MKTARRRVGIGVLLALALALAAACRRPAAGDIIRGGDEDPDLPIPTGALEPASIAYLGAFRLPAGQAGQETQTFDWGGMAMAYYPGGDAGGAADGFPGSLFIAGHEWAYPIAEVTIPAPAAPEPKDREKLPQAALLQPFHDIFAVAHLEQPRGGLAYLPAQPGQSGDKLYLCWGAHFQRPSDRTHAWCELTLANPRRRGNWFLDAPFHEYNSNDYMCPIPANWSAAHAGGMRLATGRFRDGGWSGQGPTLYAIGPWQQGDPPPDGTALSHRPLLRYTSSDDYSGTAHVMAGYHHSDEWSGVAWLTAGERAAVVFAGTKGQGDCWYGDPAGPCLDCENRGWWSTTFSGRLIFYDPAELAQVARGETPPWQPQPYAFLSLDEWLYAVSGRQQKRHLGAICFDRERGHLFVVEFRGDGDRPLIHVLAVR